MDIDEMLSALRAASKSARMMHTPTFSDLMADSADTIEEQNRQFLELAHKYTRLAAHNEWIPASKLVPYPRRDSQERVDVIVAYDTGDVGVTTYEFLRGWQTDMKDHITHWKFMPEHPNVGPDEYGGE